MRRIMRSGWIALVAMTATTAAGLVFAGVPAERRDAPAYVAELLADLPAAAERLETHSPVREAIAAGRLDEAREMLSFRPLGEAPVPEGFPAFTPVGVIEVKRYPAYRKAVGPGFWPLFNHIKTQGIPMTAPVEMTRAPTRDGRGRGMAFLYQNTAVGAPGPIDGVAVEDTPETLVVSLGARGRMTAELAEEAKRRLEAWLADHPEYRAESDTPFRLFGYSSPMVPDADKYWEAQLLLAPITESVAE